MIYPPAPEYKSGFVSVIGRPNVGKSTLINALLGQKIAAVSPRSQTTRRRQLGILTRQDAQIIFMDTPGIHKPQHQLGEYMNQEALDTLRDADVILWMVDASEISTPGDELCANYIKALSRNPPVILALNKVDLMPRNKLKEREEAYLLLLPKAFPLALSSTTGYGQDVLLNELVVRLPIGPPFYDQEQVTDFYEREIAAELIREAALLHLNEEVPHAIAVRIDDYKERGPKNAYIAATVYVEKDSHKGIVIGRGGEMLKKIGTTARKEIEAMCGRTIYLELRVKLNKNWRNTPDALRLMGYNREKSK